ncbi:MAG: hypothetical protein GY866_34390, partial [Proteobacteria bacterium]|nr:hypothetical protein [Pseudomonadota bacterium]
FAADYYNALYDFNQFRKKETKSPDEGPETKEEAVERIIKSRPTVNKNEPVMYQPEFRIPLVKNVKPENVAPGFPPKRFKGKKPKCFFAMFKSFLGASLMGYPAEPEDVHRLLTSNLPFARVCGFIPKGGDEHYWSHHVPSLRKIEQFDQIMTEYGIWDKMKWSEVKRNVKADVIKMENVLVGDTTHYHAYSAFETVTITDEKGKEKRKSQSKTTKKCGCKDKTNCPHPWELADDGAGTIVKAHKKIIWGHKASIIGLPLQGIPLDAAAVADAATHDGETFYPHVDNFFNTMPEVESWIETVLYDSACNDQKLKDTFWNEKGIVLKTSMNPRRRKPVTEGLPKGMDKITPQGEMICKSGFGMDYKGARYELEKFIYQAPRDEGGKPVCSTCESKPFCCPLAKDGRVLTISFDTLPHIDPEDPPMAKRFKAMMKRRPSVERMIKRLKCDLGDDRLKKRGNASFQASLDKTMIAFHIMLRR